MLSCYRRSLISSLFLVHAVLADGVIHRYEADVVPYDPSMGWIIANPCDPPCSESLSNGRFGNHWTQGSNLTNYHYWIAQPPISPPSLWVEWRFRSNHPKGPNFSGCDGRFVVHYALILDLLYMDGDTVVSFSGADIVTGLAFNEFHTFRFESFDGVNYTFSVDGNIFVTDTDNEGNGFHYLQFGGNGGCAGDQVPNAVNEWDYVRYGTLASGEKIVSTDPPSGHVGPAAYTPFTTFRVKFDAANYVYINDITVQSPGSDPIVTATRRREQDDVDTVEIVLDRPLPPNERTVFILQDGPMIQAIDYDFRPLSTIPTLSPWCAVVLTFTLLAAGTVILRKQPRPT